ncbi:hypothetical protein CCAX7_16610 [Capsulimonas corticalis]|uniref:Uncharacterized protein n=1 Tax=Capsulimonas corticalis TaxID=2219043 RepID=A0A402CYT8_9BACT|nr:acyltransferase [Capsulimonas corticalis]BDI29610.1 hypothetical protein CCAX7_16610 [Capsulimonas corticalis]
MDFLDGLRALAAIWVVLSHLWILLRGMNAHSGLLGFLTNWALYSHLAVDIFIVLSGYCLILPVVRAGELRGGALDFFRRRARRILPPCYAALALAILIYLVGHHGKPFPWLALLSNIFLVQDAFLKWNIFDGPLWSVAVEWRIYFLFPAIVGLLKRHGPWAVLAASAALSGALTAAIFAWRMDFLLSCPWYLFLFALGVCAGWAAPRSGARWDLASWTLLLLTALLLGRNPITAAGGADFGRHMPMIDTVTGAAIAAALIALHQRPESRLRQALSFPPLVRIGQRSYSLYLIHIPLLLLLSHILNMLALPWLRAPLSRAAALTILGLPSIALATWGFYHAVERRFLVKASSGKPSPG